jgi:anti-sigma factor RsiW
VSDEKKIREQLHARFDSVLEEPIPARMHMQGPVWFQYARAALLVAIGIAIGLAAPLVRKAPAPASQEGGIDAVSVSMNAFPVRAARAHLVFSNEVRHPVEVGANEQEHLVRWLSKRLDTPLRVPVLTQEGYELLGGRLLAGRDGPVAQFMYEAPSSKKRLTLYVVGKTHKEQMTAFRFASEGPVSVFYWVDPDCGYALSGEIGKADLARIADVVYKQLEAH